MLSLSNFTTHPKFNNTCISQHRISKAPHLYPKNVNFLNFYAVSRKFPSGFCLYAAKSQRKGEKNVLEMELSEAIADEDEDEDEDEVEDEDFYFEDEDGDEDDDEVIIPLRNMKKWIQNKPRGFGEGKNYDTPVEDKLMEEIEQSRKAQLANVNILKNNPEKGIPKKEIAEKSKVSKDVYEGFRVRLVNLPKKKNVHRDLKLAFQGVSGILNIVPAVYGNKKTRDPVCKGLAFVDFKSENEAFRFVQTFSGQDIAFGKVQKQITCELLNSDLAKSAYKPPRSGVNPLQRLPPLSVDENPDTNITPSIDSLEESDANDEHSSDMSEDGEEILAESDVYNVIEEEAVSVTNLDEKISLQESKMESIVKQEKKKSENGKKGAPKRKKEKEKSPKLNIPGSANRLKIKEKAMLTDVFSKYAVKPVTATKG